MSKDLKDFTKFFLAALVFSCILAFGFPWLTFFAVVGAIAAGYVLAKRESDKELNYVPVKVENDYEQGKR